MSGESRVQNGVHLPEHGDGLDGIGCEMICLPGIHLI